MDNWCDICGNSAEETKAVWISRNGSLTDAMDACPDCLREYALYCECEDCYVSKETCAECEHKEECK